MTKGDYVFILLLVCVIFGCVYLLLPAYTKYDEARSKLHHLEKKQMQQDLKAQKLREHIYRLKSDPEEIERVAREKLGWCRQDEKIYHFDPPQELNNDE